MGDLNAQVGADNYGMERFMGKNGLGSRYENGDLLVDFCNANRLVIGGTVFKHKTCNKVTWVHPDGHTENQMDHIMIQQRWRKSMCDVRNIRNADVGSDHHLVVMSLKLKTAAVLRQSQNAARNPKFNTNALSDPDISRSYTLNCRASSLNVSVDSDVDEMWGEIKSVFMEAGSETVPRRARVSDSWIYQDTWEKIELRKLLKLQINAETDVQRKAELRNEYRIAHKMVYRCVRRDRRVRKDGLADNAKKAARRGDIRELYQIAKEVVRKKSNNNHPVIDMDGTLLGAEVPQLNIDIEPPLVAEIETAINLLKNNKAAGLDGVPAEFLKADPATAANILHQLIQSFWENETYPREWKDGVIVKVPKKVISRTATIGVVLPFCPVSRQL
ncbi:uncharacterized protein LOC129946652 [Eupeodes corollae]|uniref:uncharacterized protein LOC129946652 n=1 Tax=Eupeodes corollae TaxID=290404 RepID=UPI0024936E45|nr:uncharacterized protein LOC129946652 [Eupeodes corollae]